MMNKMNERKLTERSQREQYSGSPTLIVELDWEGNEYRPQAR